MPGHEPPGVKMKEGVGEVVFPGTLRLLFRFVAVSFALQTLFSKKLRAFFFIFIPFLINT